MGRTKRADLWTKKLLLPWAASLGVDYGSAKRSWPKLKTKGDPWTWGCSSWIYSDDSVMEAGETGFELPRPENELIKKGVLFHLSITSSKITICQLQHFQPSNAQLREGPGGRSHSSCFSSNPSSLFLSWHNGSSHCEPQNQKYGRLARKWENLIIGWICVLKASSTLAETSASSQKKASLISWFLMLQQPN